MSIRNQQFWDSVLPINFKNMTIRELFMLNHWTKDYGTLKVTVRVVDGVRIACIRDYEFYEYGKALNYIQQELRYYYHESQDRQLEAA